MHRAPHRREQLETERAARASAEARRDVLQASLQKAEKEKADLQLRLQKAMEEQHAGDAAPPQEARDVGEVEAELRSKVGASRDALPTRDVPICCDCCQRPFVTGRPGHVGSLCHCVVPDVVRCPGSALGSLACAPHLPELSSRLPHA